MKRGGESSILNKESAMGRWPNAVFGVGQGKEKGVDGELENVVLHTVFGVRVPKGNVDFPAAVLPARSLCLLVSL